MGNKMSSQKLSYAELKQACKDRGLTNSALYRKFYKKHGFPAHPERIYSEWVSYRDFFEISEFISYSELKNHIVKLGFKNAKEYKSFIKGLNDPSYTLDPEGLYPEWENWYKFLGKEEPFKPDFIPNEYGAWAMSINAFMTKARGGGTKESHLCRFVKLYIIPFDHSKSPHEFLTKEKLDLKPFNEIVASLKSDHMKRKIISSVKEFLDYVIKTDLTIEDEETGEIMLVANTKNPFVTMLAHQDPVSANAPSETTKPCLQYHFVKRVQDWIIPSTAKTFHDLKSIQIFDADWIKVDASIINKKDPDCVYRIVDGQAYLWIPIDWIHTYALTKVPLRGRQIAYNDSGEADEYIADIDSNGKIIWVKNTSLFAGITKNQSFISKLANNQLGIFTTTNKTSNNGAGYTIPWIPEELAYWLVRLRKWQQKYNAIEKPTAWIDCKRTNLNEIQRKARGINCFLFRRWDDCEAATVANALTPRLAAALYHIQPSNLQLAETSGNLSILSRYSSKYTPHSMRVSLITAYVVEMGMPIEIIMKVVGHSSVIMSIYYCKISNEEIRRRLNEGEKLALKSEAIAIQKTIEQNKIEELKNQLVGSNNEMLQALTNDVPAGNYVFRDYGICPYAASRCDDGGEQIQANKAFNMPTPNGYLGAQNCLRCRHFITGPAFLGGLLAITNEILLESNDQSVVCSKLQAKIDSINELLYELDQEEYAANIKHQEFTRKNERYERETELRNIESEYETAARKLDMLLCDIQSSYAHISRCQSIMNQKYDSSENKELNLVTMMDAEIKIEMEEAHHFQQLQEVCSNAVIYRSCNADKAIYPRTQLFDKMAMFNDMIPQMFTLTKEQQLFAGNEIFKLLSSRLKSWDQMMRVIDCKVKFSELDYAERISSSDIELILSNSHQLIER
ncbi:gamma-mobile-trio integrase GmtZ [Wohlfahrtiimonas chitiniclastica]|nr:VPA1269 family protein [Wohlfahrtiimonas chitiniclastica]